MFIGGLLDGLLDSSTGAYRAQRGELIGYSSSASQSLPRSRIPLELENAVSSVPGISEVGGLGTTQVAARPGDEPQSRDLISTILIGYETPPRGLDDKVPEQGTVFADSSVRAEGIEVGDTLLLGAPRVPVKVVGFIDDSRYSGQISLWASLETWQEAAQQIRPGSGDPDMVQAFVISSDNSDPAALIPDIENATEGQLEVLTVPDAIEALPGVSDPTLDHQSDHRGHRTDSTGRRSPVLRAHHHRAHNALRGTQGHRCVKPDVVRRSHSSGRRCDPRCLHHRCRARDRLGSGHSTWLSTLFTDNGPGPLQRRSAPSGRDRGLCLSLRRVLRIDPATAIGA